MSADLSVLLPLAFVIGVPVLIVLQAVAHDRYMQRQRHAIYAQFDALIHDDPTNARGSYAGRAAAIVYEFDDEPKGGKRRMFHKLTIHRVFRNEHGEYFLFISGNPPYVTHISRERAKNALRDDKGAFEREFGGAS
ncbi:MAG: hypothetical protein KA260_11090 [Burkholderiales bacterium]|nr:hypothetical protein [Burkholderiales bacterium]